MKSQPFASAAVKVPLCAAGIRGRRGFTLVEIMIVVAIITLLAAIAVPAWIRSRKRAQAARIHAELDVIEGAMVQYALENGKPKGFSPVFDDLAKYVKKDTLLYTSGGKDLYGNAYGPFTVDVITKVPTVTYSALSDAVDDEFWGPYH
jgi:prepilin-type N-terminal cleavage/methylation domain-containing protein